MSEIKTPGVHVKEVIKFPPSVAQVETAVPSFIGYTQIALDGQKNLFREPTKITSMLDYETYFGTAAKESIKLKDTKENGLTLEKPNVKFLMYYSLQMYFANGGGPCYIVSAGSYTDEISKAALKLALDASADTEESTLVVFPDAVSLPGEEEFYALYQDAISQANDLKNRFVILDTFLGDTQNKKPLNNKQVDAIGYLREKIGTNMRAAAYFPHLKTVLNYNFNEDTPIVHDGLQVTGSPTPFFATALAELAVLKTQAELEILDLEEEDIDTKALIDIMVSAIAVVENVNVTADAKVSLTAAQTFLQHLNANTATKANIPAVITALIQDVDDAEDKKGDANGITLKALKASNSALYNQIKKEIEALRIVLPPSSAMAGIYAKTDSTKGVWKAPANIGLNYVTGVTQKISDKEQESLNVNENGKSVNAIRNFTGKGTLVWGARTFDSENTEWKYVSVRRLFDMVEKSVENATSKFLFEPNVESTWIRAKAMIENYLNQLWMSGALAGTTPEQAYYVVVGRGVTTPEEIQEGIMNIQIGMAAVRPAEFIVLNFSHKLQES